MIVNFYLLISCSALQKSINHSEMTNSEEDTRKEYLIRDISNLGGGIYIIEAERADSIYRILTRRSLSQLVSQKNEQTTEKIEIEIGKIYRLILEKYDKLLDCSNFVFGSEITYYINYYGASIRLNK